MKHSFSRVMQICIANLAVTLVFFSIVIPGIIWDRNNTFQAVDQNHYHLRQVEIFVNKPLTWGTYPSTTATTPGHHLVLSWVSKHFADGQVGAKVLPIRIANALFSLGLLLTLWWLTYLGGTENAIESTYLVLPFLFSYQFLGNAIWVMTDNAALLWTCLTLLLLTLPTRLNRETFTLPLAGIFAALAVFWRQTYIWLLVPLFLCLISTERTRQNWQLYITTLLPPLLVLGYFLSLWSGLAPPEFVNYHDHGLNFAVPIFIISLFGIFGVFYTGYLSAELQKIKTREMSWVVVISVIVGFSIAMMSASNYDRVAGRRGGWLWEIARHLPSIYDRSVLFLVLVPLGTVLLSLWYKANSQNKNKSTILILITMIAWIAFNTANARVFQRYFEPFVLITLTFLASRQIQHSRRSYLGLLILTALMAAISLQQLVFGSP